MMADRFFGVSSIILGIFFIYISRDYPIESRILPVGVIGLTILFSIYILVQPDKSGKFDNIPKLVAYFLAAQISVVLMDRIGFFVAMIFFICASLIIQGVRNVRIIFTTVCATGITIYIIFIWLFSIPLPTFIE